MEAEVGVSDFRVTYDVSLSLVTWQSLHVMRGF